MSRHALILAIALSSLAACKQQVDTAAVPVPAAPAKPVPPPSAASKQLIAEYMAAWNAHDPQKAGSFFSDDAVYVDANMGAPQNGRHAIVDNVIDVFMRGFPDSHWEMLSDPVATPDSIAFEWTFSGINTGTWSGLAATNQKLSLRGVSFVRIKDGKIVYEGNYYDGLTMNKQMGW